MFEEIRKSVQQFGRFNEEELTLFTTKIQVKQLLKNDFLLVEGKICTAIYFLNKGSLRHFTNRKDDTERTLNLFIENDWVLDYQSFATQKPTKNKIQAFEQSEVFELNVLSLHELIAISQKFLQMGKLLELGLQNTDLYSEQASPEEKYLELLANKPLLIQKFPLKYIASYLKITPETLSRIRRKTMIS